jgi:hypothetical protein
LLFGLTHLLLASLVGSIGVSAVRALVVIMGFASGLGLSVALWAQPTIGRRIDPVGWLLRAGAAVLAFVGAQGAFIAVGKGDYSISIVWSGSTYRANLVRFGSVWWQGLLARFPNWPDAAGLIDAALVALVMTTGITAGVLVAARWLARWRSLVLRAGD